jgi:hypothetical protein
MEIEGQVRVAVRDALNRKSRKPFYWGGLKGYEQLEAIAKALGEVACDEPETDYLQRRRTGSTWRISGKPIRGCGASLIVSGIRLRTLPLIWI